jgi:hypothetical protein
MGGDSEWVFEGEGGTGGMKRKRIPIKNSALFVARQLLEHPSASLRVVDPDDPTDWDFAYTMVYDPMFDWFKFNKLKKAKK